MAEIFPSFENIDRLKVKPTDGEIFLINWLVENLSDEYEVYFQPFLNGDMPDVIIMKRESGVVIIEVKDWNLSAYSIDPKNKWAVVREQQPIKSPFEQVFGYKSNMFQLHISGLAEKNVLNKNVYHIIKSYVYFHETSKNDIDNIYSVAESNLKKEHEDNNLCFRNKHITFEKYERKRLFLDRKSKQIRRDRSISLYENNISKLLHILKSENRLFTDELYYEFRRYLKPPYHVADQGKDIEYGKKQSRLITSNPIFQKIKGVAGSGKTTVLAKRAVNAHKRHSERVLILTYNKTLRNLIRDKISDVREDFSWGVFAITNYHSFITQQLNACQIDVKEMIEKSNNIDTIFSDENLFDVCNAENIVKYKTILIDEIQDYKPEWIKIVRKYFLSENGEMVLFGDESQNVYDRNISKENSAIVQGFGRWERLTKSYRYTDGSKLFAMIEEFKNKYLSSKYDIDTIDSKPYQSYLDYDFDLFKGIEVSALNTDKLNNIYECVFKYIQEKKIHPNDVTIISKDIVLLRGLDKIIRDRSNEKTMTTFETEEDYIKLYKNNNKDELQLELEKIRGGKKFSFNLNSGLLKLSTVHSFKGAESPMVVYILTAHDKDELVYTGITRSKKDLLLFVQDSSDYLNFFQSRIGMEFDTKIS